MPRHIACLTFDFDAISLWLARGLTTPTPVSRGEFGAVGAARILDLLRRQELKATWFVPGHTLETYPGLAARIHAEGHEIGQHGYTHQAPATLAREDEEAAIVRCNEIIARLTGSPARGYRSPSWDLSPHTVELLLAHGFIYDSSMMGQDYLPYRCRRGDEVAPDQPVRFGEPTRLIEMPISWSLDDFPRFEYMRTPNQIQPGHQRAEDVLADWLDEFRYMRRAVDWGVLTYTFHPQVIGRGHRMLMLERLVSSLAGMGAVFLTLAEAAAEFAGRG